ncbi:universal stress protein [Chitinophaga sp. XS-30]|uniref:universal stress protein n=1 Tax=Chitinophaga sp. XS-30 TaxID=2604421 RepID=UPI0011DC7B93|nr:universal stress protein [Chitinophaga sp. XS-30]QEH43220.1 universal stress protein [Chitinophaga sp. XS-30]
MKKIIAALDGLRLNQTTIQTAITLAGDIKAHLVGIFLDDFTRNSFSMYEVIEGGEFSEKKLRKLAEKDRQIRDLAVKDFELACQEAGIQYSVRRDTAIALQDLLKESIYADLLVIGSRDSFSRIEEPPPARFLRDLLSAVQCPVLVTPEKYTPIKKVVMLYDGAPASVFAIKMFTGIMPRELPVEVITVKDDNLHLPENKLMKEFMKRHCPRATYKILKGEAEKEIQHHLLEESPGSLIVLGAYQRSAVSRWFRESMADVLIRSLESPLFIAHNK